MRGYLDTIPHPWTLNHIQNAMLSNFQEVAPAIDRTEGGKLWHDLKDLDDAIWILTTSIAELQDEISVFGERSKDGEFWSKTNEKDADRYVREVKRRLYYCTSAVMTLVDIARNFSKKWPVDGLAEKRAEIFSVAGLHEFLQRLRNYNSHWRIAKADWRIDYDFTVHTRTVKFLCAKEDLLKWDDWTVPSKIYIENCGENVDIYKAFSQYKNQVQQYYSWKKGMVLDRYSSILQPFFKYKRMHEGLQQARNWNSLLSSASSSSNPYQFIVQNFDRTQIETLLSYERNSEQQIEALIRTINMADFFDENLRNKINKFLKVD
ncbi:hypothetical protein [Pseudomonas sp.]|uniref:hypothetical protein n=1 Tax=Pseudomonas sp. TaxID=306 RepID=UPI003BB056F3